MSYELVDAMNILCPAKWEKITPETAAQWLALPRKDRKISKGLVAKITRDIEAGHYRQNGEAIIIDQDGCVLDGQHRLTAVVDADMPIISLVVRGVDREVHPSLDGGRMRTFADSIGIDGVANSVVVASIAQAVRVWQEGRLSFSPYEQASKEELRAVLSQHPGIVGVAHYVACAKQIRVIMPLKVAGFMRYVTHTAHPVRSNEFFDKLQSGEAMQAGDPILTLRNWLINNNGAGRKRETYHVLAYVIKGWNAFFTHAPLKTLRVMVGAGEAYPALLL